ncbi:hypothetical protein [Streptomyces hirsutus]|uniref:hypothetical protein n=1 Tax=Streptomyces hirsutus TaxID=35620 RepID=UPI0006E42E3B|nr:hypothetical protein [Streptomyces hirsutus]
MTDIEPPSDQAAPGEERWLKPGVRGIGSASFLADVGHEIPTALLPSLLTSTLGAPAAARCDRGGLRRAGGCGPQRRAASAPTLH